MQQIFYSFKLSVPLAVYEKFFLKDTTINLIKIIIFVNKLKNLWFYNVFEIPENL